ncbi:alpha/beta fold hydrolase [Microbacterium aurantiacum]|uniref:Esterase n=1 Tax=Microbacterium aurantiacum TaxID=162393 RepID=A0A0M8MH40_9MICO|nr:esterase [Microbacterium chocolatum]KOS12336.1 esterase [Microbacterium chocolatum]
MEGPVAYRDRYETNRLPAILLIPGHWLGAWAWDEVVEHLDPARERTVAMTLPGLDPADPARATRTLDDQVDAILAALAEADAAARPAVIVAHSGANAPVSVVLDRHPELIRRVVWVDSGPAASGAAFAPDLPDAVEDMPLPSFDALAQQASLEGLSADGLERFRTRAVPEPGLVLRQPIALSNPRRHAVPTTLVCCSLPSAQVREWAGAGHPMFAEVALLEDVTLVDLPTGHWPMWSRPADLAETIRVAAQVE